MKIIIALLILLPSLSFAKTFEVSSTTLNSITCPQGEAASDIFYSEKAPLKVEARKNKVFFEFTATKEEVAAPYDQVVTKYKYAKETVAVMLFCGDTEHLLTLQPKERDGVTIMLEPENEKAVKELFDGLKREEQIAEIVKVILTGDQIIKSFRKEAGSAVGKINDVDVYLRNIYTGGGFTIKELYLYSSNIQQMAEEDLLTLPFINMPVAAALLNTSFEGWSRAVVIEAAR